MSKTIPLPKKTIPLNRLNKKKATAFRKQTIDAHESLAQAEFGVIADVLAEYLNRSPDETDMKRCARYYPTDEKTNEYGLLYDNHHLGRIQILIVEGEVPKVIFIPNEIAK